MQFFRPPRLTRCDGFTSSSCVRRLISLVLFFLLPVHLSRDGGSKQVFPIVKEVKEFVLLGRIKYVSFRTLPSSRLVLLSLGVVSSSSPLHLSENSMCELFPVGYLCFIVLLHSLP